MRAACRSRPQSLPPANAGALPCRYPYFIIPAPVSRASETARTARSAPHDYDRNEDGQLPRIATLAAEGAETQIVVALDTNVVVRFLVNDDVRQARKKGLGGGGSASGIYAGHGDGISHRHTALFAVRSMPSAFMTASVVLSVGLPFSLKER